MKILFGNFLSFSISGYFGTYIFVSLKFLHYLILFVFIHIFSKNSVLYFNAKIKKIEIINEVKMTRRDGSSVYRLILNQSVFNEKNSRFFRERKLPMI